MVSFYSSFPPFPVNICVFNKRSGSLRASRESINLSTDLSLSLLPQLKLLCTFFWEQFSESLLPLCCSSLSTKKKKKQQCKVLSLILRCSAIFHQPFVFSFFYQLLLCLNCSASLSQIRLVFFSFLPLIMLFLLPGVPFCTISIKIHPFTMPTSKSYLPPENPLGTASSKLPWLIQEAFVTYIQLVVLIVYIPIYTG